MVDAHRPEPNGELGRSRARQLFGVHAQPKARAAGRAKHPLGVGEREESLVAEHVAELGQTFHGDGREHLVRDRPRIVRRR